MTEVQKSMALFSGSVNPELADEIAKLAGHAALRKIMGAKGRAVAEREFDQPRSYRAIVDLLRTLL